MLTFRALHALRFAIDPLGLKLDPFEMLSYQASVIHLTWRLEMLAKRLDHCCLNLRGWDAHYRSGFIGATLKQNARQVVAIPAPGFGRVTWAHAIASVIEDAAGFPL